ncbi:retrovirus-related pol polyprotein from transposon TNT 1-94 [Tanacetum coccineum]
MHEAHTIVQTHCLELEAELSKLQDKVKKDDHTELVKRFSNLKITQLTEKVTVLQEQNELFREENEKVKQHYKDLYDSIKITRAKHIEQTTALLTENESLKAQIHENLKCNTMESVKPRVFTPGRYAIDVEPIPPHNRNNREVHLHYLKHLKESVETLHEIVEEAKVERVNCCTNASESQPRSNTKKNRISPAKGVNKKKVEEHPRINKSNLRTTNRVDSSSSSKHTASPSIHNIHNVVRKVKQVWKPKQVRQEGLGHNLFFVRQFYDSDLEVAFRKHSCFVQDTDGVELIKGSRGSNLYTISIEDMMKSSLILLLSKASKNKSWLWHRRLNHLNFRTINDLARKDLVKGLPRLKFEKAHLCSACQLGKSKNHTRKPKTENTNLDVLHTLHMDLYLTEYYERVGIFHQKSVLRTPQQNGVVKRRNRTLVEAAKTMLIFSKALMFLWAEVVATACYTQNRSLIHTRHNKTPYELVHDKKTDLTFFRVFGALCYPTNDSKDLVKLQPTTNTRIFVGYAPSRRGYKIYNKRTRRIMETIHVQFDELTKQTAPMQLSTGPAPTFFTHG